MVSVAFQTLKLQNELTAFQLMPTYTSFTKKQKKSQLTQEKLMLVTVGEVVPTVKIVMG